MLIGSDSSNITIVMHFLLYIYKKHRSDKTKFTFALALSVEKKLRSNTIEVQKKSKTRTIWPTNAVLLFDTNTRRHELLARRHFSNSVFPLYYRNDYRDRCHYVRHHSWTLCVLKSRENLPTDPLQWTFIIDGSLMHLRDSWLIMFNTMLKRNRLTRWFITRYCSLISVQCFYAIYK